MILQRKYIIGLATVIAIGSAYYWYANYYGNNNKMQYITDAVERKTISASVTGTGQVDEQDKIDIKSQSSGVLTSVNVKQGQQVSQGQLIATVDQKNALISLNQAKAGLATAQANYNKLTASATSQDVAVSQASVDSAKVTLNNAKNSYNNIVQQHQLAVSNARQSLLNSTLAAAPASSNLSSATISISGTYSGTEEGQYTIKLSLSGSGYSYDISGIDSLSSTTFGRGVPLQLGSHGLYLTISTTGTLNAGDTWTVSIPNKQATNYLSNYNSHQSALQSQIQVLANAQASIDSAQASLNSSQAALALKEAPPTSQDIEQAQAQMTTAQLQLQNAQIVYDNNFIKAPFAGQIAVLNNQVGDLVSSGTAIAILIGKQKIAQISLNEVDVAKIKLFQPTSLTFDAIDGLNIAGKVSQIDTIGTVNQGVVTYNIQSTMDVQDDRIKPGMSVTANIIMEVKPNVLAIPNSALKSDATGSYVQILNIAGKPQKKYITVGVSDDTSTEVLSGINEGDRVVTQTTTTPTTSTSGGSSTRFPGVRGG